MELRELSMLQVIFVYDTYMKEDFPAEELKPLQVILDMTERGLYDCLGLYHENEFLAYAYFMKDNERGILFLDYLAVNKEHRNSGFGSIFLEQMKSYYEKGTALLLECESERTAPDEEQRRIRRRRISFYKRNHCSVTTTKSNTFGVEYNILCLPWKEKPLDITEAVRRLYGGILPPAIMEQYVRLWERHEVMRAVWGVKGNCMVETASLCRALGLEKQMPRVISLVGAGGKTTTMYQLADEFAEQGKRVVITTSTKILKHQKAIAAVCETWQQVITSAWEKPIVVLGKPAESNKLSMPDGLEDASVIDQLLQVADVILIEADGAKELPLKVPAEQEPVFLPQTDMVIACVGLQAIGKTFGESCFRMEQQGAWLRRSLTDKVTTDDVVLILMDERGSRKQVTKLSADYRIVLNQADEAEQEQLAQEIIRKLPMFLQPICAVTSYERNSKKDE